MGYRVHHVSAACCSCVHVHRGLTVCMCAGVPVIDTVAGNATNCYVFEVLPGTSVVKVALTSIGGDPDMFLLYQGGSMPPCPGSLGALGVLL